MPKGNRPQPQAWDDAVAQELVGCLVVVGLTYLYPDGSQGNQHQLFGYVVETNRDRGVRLHLEGANSGKTYWLPPDTSVFRRAPAGQYRLRSSGEVVKDPDYTCAWTIKAPLQ